ncbi:MAG: cyclic nucleotide-binding domain-containing protein [Gammaproteobacteria bacterium HGW-Gammaproteobacteria-14]|nr:MAG: cyclic nucleotide-binding domain-containing protein [Gammaproteobacteria bacterium HGW-Gammaproteobacteria-14]
MEQINRAEYPLERIQRLLSGIPFFNEVLRDSEAQFSRLLECSDIMQASPGEEVIHVGDTDTYLYFLLKGQLAVMGSNGGGSQVLNYISPGEVFGALAMIRGTPRSATIRVDDSAREAIVARLNYADFSDIVDFNYLTLETKLAFYRMLVHNIRWTLEVNKMQSPQHELIPKLRTVPIFTGAKGTADELTALYEQAHKLADILCLWNESVQPVKSNMQTT